MPFFQGGVFLSRNETLHIKYTCINFKYQVFYQIFFFSVSLSLENYLKTQKMTRRNCLRSVTSGRCLWPLKGVKSESWRSSRVWGRAGDVGIYQAGCLVVAADCGESCCLVRPFIRQGVVSMQLIVERIALSSDHSLGRVSCRRSWLWRELLYRLAICQAGCRVDAADCGKNCSLVWPFIRQGVLSSHLIVEGVTLSSGHLSGRVSCRRSWLCRDLFSFIIAALVQASLLPDF